MADLHIDGDFWNVVNKHITDNVERLRLKYHPVPGSAMDLALIHIQCAQKAGKKFIGDNGRNYAPKLLLSPLSVEQASSAAIASFHASLVDCGAHLLDMTCGLGVDTLAFATIAGCDVTTCELNPLLADAARYNFSDYENISVIGGDSVEYLRNCNKNFDVIFIDPARRDSKGGRVYNIHDCAPDVAEIMPLMMEHTSKVIVKLSPMLDITQTVRDLSPARIYSVQGDNGECKEILAVIHKNSEVREPVISIVYDNRVFDYVQSDEISAVSVYGVPAVGDTLYEPNAATMKAAPFNLLCSRFSLSKLHSNTHLYFSREVIEDFPGKAYQVVDVFNFSSSEIKNISKKYPVLNVATRNFVLTPDELLKKLKIKNGGNLKAFGVTVSDGSKKLIITKMK